MFLISVTFNICNYEDIMKKYDWEAARDIEELRYFDKYETVDVRR